MGEEGEVFGTFNVECLTFNEYRTQILDNVDGLMFKEFVLST